MVDQVTEELEIKVVKPITLDDSTSHEGEDAIELEDATGQTKRDKIYAKFDEMRKPTEPPKEEVIEEEVVEEPVALAEDETPKEPEEEEAALVEIKVNGHTSMVEKSKVDAEGGKDAYQIMLAGQEKLRKIAADKKDFEAEKLAFEQERKDFEEQKSQPTIVDTSEKDLARKEDREKLRTAKNVALLDGDLEEAGRIEVEMEAISYEEPLDRESIIAEAKKEAIQHMAEEKQVAEQQRAIGQFKIRYPSVMGDPDLFQIANRQSDLIAKEHPEYTLTEVFEAAGKYVEDKFSGSSTVTEPLTVVPTSMERKAAEKKTMSTPRGGDVKTVKQPAPQEETNNDYFKALKKSRGQTI